MSQFFSQAGSEELFREKMEFHQHEGIVFLVELADSMLVEGIEGVCKLEQILISLRDAMTHSIITMPNTGYGCYLFRSSTTSEGCGGGVQRVFGLADLNYKNIKLVQDILDENRPSEHNSEIPHRPLRDRFRPDYRTGPNPLLEALAAVQNEFQTKKPYQKLYNYKKVFLFTDNDQPVPDLGDTAQRELLRTKLRDLDDAKINIKPFFIPTDAETFNPQLYEALFAEGKAQAGRAVKSEAPGGQEGDDEDEDGIFPTSTRPIDMAQLKEQIFRRKEIKRLHSRVPLVLGEQLVVGAKCFSIFKEETISSVKSVFETENFRKKVFSESKLCVEGDEGSDRLVDPAETKMYRGFQLGGKGSDDYVVLNEHYLARLNQYSSQYDSFLKLVGFKSTQNALKPQYNLKPALFVTHDEYHYNGSARTLCALYEKLIKLDKVAIVFGKLTRVQQPRYFVLYPTNNDKLFPQGFFLKPLPFYEEIRSFPTDYEAYKPPSPALVDGFIQLLSHLELGGGYDPAQFRNPTINRHYKALNAYLLQIENSENDLYTREALLADDDTIAKLDELRQRIEDSQLNDSGNPNSLYRLITRWNELYFGR